MRSRRTRLAGRRRRERTHRIPREPRRAPHAAGRTPINGSASAPTSALTPTSATSHPVIVVPTLAPNTTQTACASAKSSALTKPTVATVTALDDCTIAVIRMPARRPRAFVRVHDCRIDRSALPAESLSPSVIIRMPSRNKPMPPRSDASVVKLTRNGLNRRREEALPRVKQRRAGSRSIRARPSRRSVARSARRYRRGIPVLVGLAVDEAPRVEPGRRVGLARLLRMRVLARDHHDDHVALGHHVHDGRRELAAVVGARPFHDLREVIDHALEPRGRVRVVLDVAVGDPLAGTVPLVALQELAHDVQRGLLVAVLHRVLVDEERFRIGVAHYRLL